MFTQNDYEFVLETSPSHAHAAAEAAKLRSRVRYHRHFLSVANDIRRYAALDLIEQTRLAAARDMQSLTGQAEQLDEEVRDDLRAADNPLQNAYSTEHAWLKDGEATWDVPPDDERGPASRALDETVHEIYTMWDDLQGQLQHEHPGLPDIPAEARETDEAERIRERLQPLAHALHALHQLANALDRL